MNTRIQIRLLLAVLAIGLAAPSVVGADTIQIGYVIYQNTIPPGDPAQDNPGTNAFYFGWLVDPLTFTGATFLVAGTDATGMPFDTGPVALGLPISDSTPLGWLEFPTSARLTSASFRGLLAPGTFVTLDGQAYAVAAQEVFGEMTADALTPFPFGLDGGGDAFYLTADADPIPVPVPEGGPGTLALVTWGALLAAAARRVRP
jgi:hypothetical protein